MMICDQQFLYFWVCPDTTVNLINLVYILTTPPTSCSLVSPSPEASLLSKTQQYWNQASE